MGIILFCKSDAVILLLALAAGYVVCFLANKEQKLMRKVGLAIGAFIIISSLLLLGCKLAWRMKTCFTVYHGIHSQVAR